MVALTGLFSRASHLSLHTTRGDRASRDLLEGSCRMSRSSLRLVVLAVLVFASPASAQIIGRPIEVSGQLGWSAPDARAT